MGEDTDDISCAEFYEGISKSYNRLNKHIKYDSVIDHKPHTLSKVINDSENSKKCKSNRPITVMKKNNKGSFKVVVDY